MKKSTTSIIISLSFAVQAANPIFTDKWTADPAPLVDGDTLYLFTGHDDAREGEMFHMEDWLCFSTKDLKTWTDHGPILRTDYTREGNAENVSVPKIEWSKDASAWAAQCVKSPHDGKYYFYFCCISKTDGMCVGVAVADKPTGPYRDALGKPLVRDCDTPSPYWGNDIDPSVFIDADGTPWMVWGNPVCYLAKLKQNMTELDGEIRVIPLPNYTEGPWLDKRGDTYYLIYPSRAHQGFGEHLDYATASSVEGPWIYRGRLTGGAWGSYTIHPGLCRFKGRDIMFYHDGHLTIDGVGGATGRRGVCAEFVDISPNGPIAPFEQTREGLDKVGQVGVQSSSSRKDNSTLQLQLETPTFENPVKKTFTDVPFFGTKAEGFAFSEYGVSAYPQPTAKGRSLGRKIDSFVKWDEGAAYKSVENPFMDSPQCDGFNMHGEWKDAMTEEFTLEKDLRLAKIEMYLTDGEGTDKDNPLTLVLRESTGVEVFSVPLDYVPQGYGIAALTIAQGKQPLLKAGKTYSLELRGKKGSAVAYWRRGFNGERPHAYALYDRKAVNCIVSDGTNPLIKDVYAADPAPMVDGDTMYLYAGHDEAVPGQWLNMTEWLCWSTKDGIHYKSEGQVMKPTDFAWSIGEAWAVQVVKRHGKYWLYATCTQNDGNGGWGGRSIGVAVSDKPTGPFKDALGYPLISERKIHPKTREDNEVGVIDPTVFIDDDGKVYLVYGNAVPKQNFLCRIAELKDNMIEFASESRSIKLDDYGEGPWLDKHDGLYYLFYVTDIHGGTVPEKHAYATAKNINGPWTCHGLYMDAARQSFGIHPGIAHFKGRNYSFYHNGMLEFADGRKGSAERRAVCVEEFKYRNDGTVPFIKETDQGVGSCELEVASCNELCVLAYQTPGKHGGLSFLVGKPDGTWEHAFHKDFRFTYSNLGHWGEKKLLEPFVLKANDGAWHVFYPYEGRPALAHAESWSKGNIRNWGRERWIELGSGVRGQGSGGLDAKIRVHAPIAEQLKDGTFAVLFLDNDGGAWVVKTDGKKALAPCKKIEKSVYDKARRRLVKKVEFEGRTFEGSVVSITPVMREMLRSEFGEWKKFPPWFMGADNVKDDLKRYGEAAKDAKLTLKFDNKQSYAISTNLIGVFFEDINSSHEIFTVKGGWREDMVKALKDLKPKFMRFPGGCIVHGRDFKSMYHWKETVGPHGTRKGKPNLFWGGYQDFELGYYEYFILCEKIGAEPVPILPAGSSCPNPQVWVTDDELKILVDDALDLVEFANGDPKKSKWAKLRADMGHPKPFNLRYMGIGNEDDINDYFERGFTAIYSAMREKYPEIKIVGSAGPAAGGRDYEEGWKLGKKLKVDILDEHYYVGPGWYYANQNFYDSYDRKGPKVYIGEYAAHKEGRVNDMETACATAIHLCNIERNGDIVEMTSYAPLFAKRSDTRWATDLIYFTDEAVELTTDYWVQWLFGNYGGSRYVPNTLALETPNSKLNRDDQARFRNRFAAGVVKDGARTILKVVNSTAFDIPFEADLAPLGVKDSTMADVIVLAGAFDDKTAQPVAQRETIPAQLVRTLPANSVTVIAF